MKVYFLTAILLVLVACADARRRRHSKTWSCKSGLSETNPITLMYSSVCEECGQSCCNRNTMKRLAYSENAQRGEFPWSVTFFRKQNGRWQYFCGGVLIHHNTIATAYHCFTKQDKCVEMKQDDLADVRATIGELDIGIDDEGYRRSSAGLHELSKLWCHNSFRKTEFDKDNSFFKGGFSHDLAIVTLLKETKDWPFVCMRHQGERLPENFHCIGIGHGRLYNGPGTKGTTKPTSRLQKTSITLDYRNECINGARDSLHLCAFKNGSTASCKEDSGSPVVCRVHPDDPCSSFFLAGIFVSSEKSKDCDGSFSLLSNLMTQRGDALLPKVVEHIDHYDLGKGKCGFVP